MPLWMNLPNLFTMLRLALVPFVIQSILEGRHFRALAIFLIAALTDLLDGAAARRLGIVTQAGAYLDPLADKCLLSGVYLALAAAHILPWWVVVVIFGRDVYILLAVGLILWATPVRRFAPSIWGKFSTFVQIVTAVTWMARNVLHSGFVNAVSAAMLWPCVGFTIWSGIHYTWRGIQMARAH